MTVTDLSELYDYSYWANRKLLKADVSRICPIPPLPS